MAEIQKAVDEDPTFHSTTKEYKLELRQALAMHCKTLRTGTRLTCKGAAKDVLKTALFIVAVATGQGVSAHGHVTIVDS